MEPIPARPPSTTGELPIERACLEGVRQGDAAAIEKLYRTYRVFVERVIGRLVGPTPDLEDLAQTTFLEAIGAIARFRGEASFKTWLTQIAVHVAQHHLRARTIRRHTPLEVVPEAALALVTTDDDRRIDDRRLGLRLHQLLDRLTPKKRIAFVLYIVEERPLPEVAALMGASQVATRSRVFFARRELRTLIAKDALLSDLAESFLKREGERS